MWTPTKSLYILSLLLGRLELTFQKSGHLTGLICIHVMERVTSTACCPLASSHRGSCVTDLLPASLFISFSSFSSAADVYVISVEQLLSKVVETYLSEKHALEKQLSSSLDVPVAAGDVESHLGPAITVQPSSTVTVEPSTDNHPHSEEQKEEEGAANVKEEEKTEAQEQKEGLLAESLMAKVILYTLY